MAEAIKKGVTRYMLYSLRDEGVLEQISRGIFRLAEMPPLSNPDLATIALRSSKAVICLTSALSFHNITTQIPHEVSIALPRISHTPRIEFPPIQVHRYNDASYQAGIEKYRTDGVVLKVYNPEKTLADCFKFRNVIGMDIVLEALKLYRTRMDFKANKILEYAKINRVEKIIHPYLEMMI